VPARKLKLLLRTKKEGTTVKGANIVLDVTIFFPSHSRYRGRTKLVYSPLSLSFS